MADPWTSDDLVGRDEELLSFERVLERRRPTVVLVTGPVGAGKSRLLVEMIRMARARGWRTAPPAGEPPYVVSRDATPRSFAQQVQRVLEIYTGAPDIDAGPTLDGRALSRGMAGSSLSTAGPETIAGDANAAALVDSIRAACPALFAIDGFRPNATFARWLSGQLVPAVKASGLPVVAVLTLETEAVEIVRDADVHLQLGRLDEAATDRYFRELGQRLSPAPSDAELRTYVKAAVERPELVDSLRRVLALAARQGR